MRILVVHNSHQLREGDEEVVDAEIALLSAYGHTVSEYRRDNDEMASLPAPALAAGTVWSRRTIREVAQLLAQVRPDVVHVHNTFPLISPSVYWAAADAGVPVVQTIHDFRSLCPPGSFLRDGEPCEDGMVMADRAAGTYSAGVARYIAPTAYCRDKLIAGGLPRDRIVIKPNFVDVSSVAEKRRSGGLFVGHLTRDKGIDTLLAAHARVEAKLTVVGEGPRSTALAGVPRLAARGRLPLDDVYAAMGKHAYLVVPSVAPEVCPRTVIEAYACGLPVIATRRGGLADLVIPRETGLLFEPDDAEDLARAIRWAEANPVKLRQMGQRARAAYAKRHAPDVNHDQLAQIYTDAISVTKDVRPHDALG